MYLTWEWKIFSQMLWFIILLVLKNSIEILYQLGWVVKNLWHIKLIILHYLHEIKHMTRFLRILNIIEMKYNKI